jgi:hypothetical protein
MAAQRSTVAVIDVENPALASELRQALSAAGVRAAEDKTVHASRVAVIRAAEDPRSEKSTSAKEIRIWTEGRSRRNTNPFASDAVRHVIGATGGVEPDLVRSSFEQLESNQPIRLADAVGNARTLAFSCSSSSEKDTLLASFESFTGEDTVPQDVRNTMAMALDELFTNAIYNAPVKEGKHLFTARSRTERIQVDRPVKVAFARNAKYLAISVRDGYGSLSSSKVISSLRRCYESQHAAPENKAGGAGLGFFMMLQGVSRMIVNIHPGEYTEIILVRRLDQRRRDFSLSAPTLNICTIDKATQPRRFRRFTIDSWPAVYKCRGVIQVAALRDLSSAGCFLATPESEPPAVGEEIEITLTSGRDISPSMMRGTVRWVGESPSHKCKGFGVEFQGPLVAWTKYLAR